MKKRWGRPGSLFVTPKSGVRKMPLWRRFLHRFRFLSFLRGLATFIGAIFLVSMVASFVAGLAAGVKQPLPEKMILTLRLDSGLDEIAVSDNFLDIPAFGPSLLSVHDMVRVLDHAATDPRVMALVVLIEGGDIGVAQVQELRAAIARFRASGKPSYAFSPSYAEVGGGMGPYYLAAAFDQIWLQPVGFVDLPGIDAKMPFVKETLKKIGISAAFYQRKEYKSVMESVSRDGMSPENREMMQSLMHDILDGILADVAADRKIDVAQLRLAVDQAIFTDDEALAAGLVDRVDYGDVLFSEIRKMLTGDPEDKAVKNYDMARYFDNVLPGAAENAPMVGFVHAVGTIVPNKHGGGMSEQIMAADKVYGAIMKGVRDERIAAIVLRIDSPGGSPTASETIRRAVERARAAGKPVVVSMGPMAGSGGYWIAVDASRIFALPSTLTGSIGVASGKFEASALMKKIGVTWEGVQIGKNADLNSFTAPFSESADERMNAMLDSIYAAFTGRVANGRHLTAEQVEKIARGRVWTGKQAVGIGLVDEIGGLDMALDHAATLAGAQDRHQIQLVELPRPRTSFDRVLELLKIDVLMDRFVVALVAMIGQKISAITPLSLSVYDPVLMRVAD